MRAHANQRQAPAGLVIKQQHGALLGGSAQTYLHMCITYKIATNPTYPLQLHFPDPEASRPGLQVRYLLMGGTTPPHAPPLSPSSRPHRAARERRVGRQHHAPICPKSKP